MRCLKCCFELQANYCLILNERKYCCSQYCRADRLASGCRSCIIALAYYISSLCANLTCVNRFSIDWNKYSTPLDWTGPQLVVVVGGGDDGCLFLFLVRTKKQTNKQIRESKLAHDCAKYTNAPALQANWPALSPFGCEYPLLLLTWSQTAAVAKWTSLRRRRRRDAQDTNTGPSSCKLCNNSHLFAIIC